MIQYCKRCCLPSTKPHLSFDEEGICNACRNYENRKQVDWTERKRELEEILGRYRSKDGTNWDCIIPVSGGKDSTYIESLFSPFLHFSILKPGLFQRLFILLSFHVSMYLSILPES